MPNARKVAFPVESQLHRDLDQAFYSDAFEADLIDKSLSPVDIATRALVSTPRWVDGLVNLRDHIASLFGLKTVGRLRLSESDRALKEPAVGDAFSIFRVVFLDSSELVLGIDDTHLNVRMSFLKRSSDSRASYVVSSWVKTHNLLGRFYMLPVAPVHRVLVKLMMLGVPM
ncbi:DUF2867 domain-containing protein [Bradyrhizobium sp. SZCCHNR1093]|uniref:DUF2867 domain-containing protein n=1 Tax=Bradyrhizobium sp. SZCCHNR1093 TaxID=3057368 RepID=UPI0028EAF304|nr:DUF2867 domain-containing protein [Bradyrhizobium sp. SZCCHNR1093]